MSTCIPVQIERHYTINDLSELLNMSFERTAASEGRAWGASLCSGAKVGWLRTTDDVPHTRERCAADHSPMRESRGLVPYLLTAVGMGITEAFFERPGPRLSSGASTIPCLIHESITERLRLAWRARTQGM
jgi:hypothetical protein